MDETELDNASIIGEMAHIVGEKQDGPRGDSTLSESERDEYHNLILLCNNHHKLVDDQSSTYTVEKLKEWKANHEMRVKKSLGLDTKRQNDDEIYGSYIDKWIELADVDEWENWGSFILSSHTPMLSVKNYERLKELNKYLLSRIWPGRHTELERALINFRRVLNDFMNVFDTHMEIHQEKEEFRYTRKFYQIEAWDPELYHKLLEKFNYHVALLDDLMVELTRAANYVCEQIRKSILPSFRISKGALLITGGPYFDLSYKTYREEYTQTDISGELYPGLREFMETRKTRRLHFGEGENPDYFPVDWTKNSE